jgi:hypothetical protein
MMELWRRVVIGSGIAVYVLGLGALGGVLVDRLRVDRPRAETLRRHNEAVPEWRQVLTDAERSPARATSISPIEVQP